MQTISRFAAGLGLVVAAGRTVQAQSVFRYVDAFGDNVDVQVPAAANTLDGSFTGNGTIVAFNFTAPEWTAGPNPPVNPPPDIAAYTYTMPDMTSMTTATYAAATGAYPAGVYFSISANDAHDGPDFNLRVTAQDPAFPPFVAGDSNERIDYYAATVYAPNEFGPVSTSFTYTGTVPTPEPSVEELLMVGCAAIPGYRFTRKQLARCSKKLTALRR